MLGVVSRAFDRFRGSGNYAATIPPMDGAFRPNEQLEKAPALIEIDGPDNLTSDGQRVWFSSGAAIYELKRNGTGATAERFAQFNSSVASLDISSTGAMAIGLVEGGLRIKGGAHGGKLLKALEGRAILCPTAIHFADADTLLVCLGSDRNDPSKWKWDLLDGDPSGSVWRVDLRTGRGEVLADRLAWPNGVIATGDGRVVVAESWRHRLVELGRGHLSPLLSEIPGYPARITASLGGGYWLAVFAPRSQLVEFVLREPRFRARMMREIDPEFWVAPSLHHTIDFREPLQAGAIKQLGELKPWAPSRSYGLIVRLNASFQPEASLHSRANGTRHGVTSCLQTDGRVLAASKGSNAILAVDAESTKGLSA